MSELARTAPDLAEIITLETLAPDVFRASSHQANHFGGVFGGSILAQAVRAAELTAPERAPHSLHGQFHRAGRADSPIEFEVARTREGASFSTRRISARQQDRLLFEALVSLQTPQGGFVHEQAPGEPPPPPLAVPTLQDAARDWELPEAEREIIARFAEGLETRIVNPGDFALRKAAPRARLWVRPRLASGRAPASNYAALAFVSDWLMPAACNLPHVRSTFDPALTALSLDHAVWFHAPTAPDAWLFYEAESPWAGGGRGLSFGRLYAEDGRLLANSAQEQLMRLGR